MLHDAEIAAFLFEHARDIILVIDAVDGRIVDANVAAEQAYRYTRAELLTMTIFELRVAPSVSVTVQMHLADSEGLLFETLHRTRDGATFPVEVSSRGATFGGRRCLFSIIRDITERKRLEAEREALLATTQEAVALREDFLIIASHELRTPVTNLSLQLQQLCRLIERSPVRTDLRVVSAAVLHEANRLSGLIDSLLDAQVAKGKLALDLEDVELSELIGEVTDRLRMRADQVGSEVVVTVPPIHGHWDRGRLDQVMTNLLLNALKYGRGQPVQVTAHQDSSLIRIEVSDHGIGVNRDDAERIFGKFERGVPMHHGGLGLGLFIVRQIVEAHHGQVEVESAPGVGSTFRVTLPCESVTPAGEHR